MDLSKKYTQLLKTGELFDTEILIGDEPNTKIFRLHSLILKISSSYFRTALSGEWANIENNIFKLQKQNVSIKVFEIITKWIYSGKIHLTDDIETSVEVLIAADELCLDDLCEYIEEKLIKDERLLKSNFILISNTTNKFDHFTKLSRFYQNAFQKDPSLILKSDDFITIDQEFLLDFLKNNGHSLEQIEIWNKLIEWAITQSDERLPSDVTVWSADNMTTLGALIKPFIPYIDFKRIAPFDFPQKIKPFKRIFDEEFYIKILEHYSFNDGIHLRIEMNIDSKIINSEHAFLLVNFVKLMEKTVFSTFYNFNLLVRGSRDGFERDTFKEYCNDKEHTIIVARVKNTNEILGGFNPLKWDKGWVNSKESFIFSLNVSNLKSSVFSKFNEHEGKHGGADTIPDFGAGNSDLRLLLDSMNKGKCYKKSYEKLIREKEGEFEIEDYEVFQLIIDN